MLIDLSVLVTESMSKEAIGRERLAAFGHLGTHFDAMGKEFPLSFLNREGIVFNVEGALEQEIEAGHVELSLVRPDTFVAFYSGYIERHGYGTREYFARHPQLSNDLIDALLDKHISIIGVDFAGIRRNPEHTPRDQYCADRGVFVVENLCNLKAVVGQARTGACTMHTYPVKFAGLTGLPCRVVAEIQ